jgi:hypothetical protein
MASVSCKGTEARVTNYIRERRRLEKKNQWYKLASQALLEKSENGSVSLKMHLSSVGFVQRLGSRNENCTNSLILHT